MTVGEQVPHPQTTTPETQGWGYAFPKAAAVKEAYQGRWMSIEGVGGVGVGRVRGRTGIVIYLERKVPELSRKIPAEIDGVPVRFEVSGVAYAASGERGTISAATISGFAAVLRRLRSLIR
jgi:hypothetical protein